MEPTGARRWRIRYEWILGGAFVATFVVSAWMECFVGRALWLFVVGPTTGASLGVKRGAETPSPRFGVLILVATLGWLWFAVSYILLGARSDWVHRHAELEAALWSLVRMWPLAALLGACAHAWAAVQPGRYREFAVFANASFLLALAWLLDAVYSPKSC